MSKMILKAALVYIKGNAFFLNTNFLELNEIA